MDVFLMHVGHHNVIDIDHTVTRKRSIAETLSALPHDAPERPYFAPHSELDRAFPTGLFNCWGVPSLAEPSFDQVAQGDLVLMVPHIGVHEGGVRQIGVVKAKCPVRCHAASRILWPATPDNRLFPLIFFFDAEFGTRPWYDFLGDLGIAENWNPRGWFRRLGASRFDKWGGGKGYLNFLRTECGFGISADTK